MSSTTPDEYRRRDDQYLETLTRTLSELGDKMDDMKKDFHQMEINMAELKAIQYGKVAQVEYRVAALETKYETVMKYIMALVIAFVSGAIGIFWQWVNSGGGAHPK